MKSEAVILAEVLLALGARPDCRVWRNNTGKLPDPRIGGRWVSFGLEGSADILGILRGGRFLAVETKSDTGRLRPAQQRFRDMVEGFGGLYVLARSAEQATAAVDAALRGAA